MKLQKKILSLLLVSIFCFTPIANSYAYVNNNSVNNHNKEINTQYINNKLKNQGVELVPISKARTSENLKTLDFKNEEEFIKFVKNFKSQDRSVNEAMKSRASDIGHLKWYAPFSGFGATGIANWKNIKFNYTYSKNSKGVKTINKITNIKSDISGIQIAVSWKPQNTVCNIAKDKKSANFKISGYYLLGITINGTPIGAKINNTWKRTFKI